MELVKVSGQGSPLNGPREYFALYLTFFQCNNRSQNSERDFLRICGAALSSSVRGGFAPEALPGSGVGPAGGVSNGGEDDGEGDGGGEGAMVLGTERRICSNSTAIRRSAMSAGELG